MQANLIINVENPPLDLKDLSRAVFETLKQKENISAEVIFVTEEEIKKLNYSQRGIDKITDVLSFPTLEGHRNKVILKNDYPLDVDEGAVFLGSIAVCLKRAKEQALEYGHSEKREIAYLICHGLLHLFGYDHLIDEDKKEMRNLEEIIMNKIGIKR